MSMSSKGISAMIATVLLIAFTVAVGGILSVWLTTLTSTQTTTTGSAAEKQILCSRSVLTISEVQYNNALGNINVTYVYTYGTESLTSLNFFVTDAARNMYNKTYSFTLNPGDSNVSSITTSGLAAGNLQSVRLQAMCQTNYPISTECKSGQSCMNKG